MTIDEKKSVLRRTIRERAAALSPAYRRESSRGICENLLALPELSGMESGAVFSFFPTAGEPQLAPVLEELLDKKIALALPRCVSPGVMESRRVEDLSSLAPGAYGIPEPGEDAPLIPWGRLSLALIPCLAADRKGNRLGHGGGYYDRFLANASPEMTAVLVCFEELLVERVPTGPLDVPVPILVTEKGVRRAERPAP